MRHPRSRVSHVRMSEMRGSFLSIRISIVRDTVSVTPIPTAKLGLALAMLLAFAAARAADEVCPPPPVLTGAPPPARTPTNPADQPIQIESDDSNFSFDANGHARLCGNVVMTQGDRTIRADCVEIDQKDQHAKLDGGIEYKDPMLTVRG